MYPIDLLNTENWIIAICLMCLGLIAGRLTPLFFAWLRKRKQMKHFLEYKQQRRKMVKL